ncbi:thermonuclease family protein [Rhizobium terrae]|uniref:thermonuclease family protein n=1 Tax=Rhizobium terrae TaxID=2171756 RepID=UPI001D02F6D9|nr:thermonuclease family protein [Rhizobium terrae]
MRSTILTSAVSASFVAVISAPSFAADFVQSRLPGGNSFAGYRIVAQVKGRAAALDGRTLWFADAGLKVQLAGIDACALPQWSFDPQMTSKEQSRLLPVPCGPFAKAWLKRTVGNKRVDCRLQSEVPAPAHRCTVRGRDLGREMLRAGWARTSSQSDNPGYAAVERYAKAARYGMWATYVLDMDEWRERAIDRTADRQPIADYNLLKERRSEISPPFADARRLPSRHDR